MATRVALLPSGRGLLPSAGRPRSSGSGATFACTTPALTHAISRFERVLPVFVVDPGILDGCWASAKRRWFLAGALTSLRSELAARGAPLLVVRGDPAEAVPRLAVEVGARAVVVSRDRSPYGRARDAARSGRG